MRPILLALVVTMALPSAANSQTPSANKSAKIRNALSAAPAAVAEGATVMLPQGDVLHKGTNGWVCLPDDPGVPNNSPMCLDETWLEVIDAWVNKRAPRIKGVGISYMLQGDMPVSNVDPFASGPTPTNQWIADGGPHIMVVVADSSLLAGIPTEPGQGGPWVMWAGTPYAHIMIPTVPRR